MLYNINESERNRILRMHSNQKSHDILINESKLLLGGLNESVVITDWLSPDDRYLILFDELYDLSVGKKLGDIWENFDNLKLFLSHSYEVATNIPKQIQESALKSLKSLVLTESISDLSKTKYVIKLLLKEGGVFDWIGKGAQDVGKFFADSGKKFASDIGDSVSKAWEGMKKAGVAISKGDFQEIFNLLGRGLVFFARKLKSLLVNPIGMVLDAMLVATGIGKSVQWIPWAIVVALDLYELTTGDFEEKDVHPALRGVFIGFDVLGLVMTGAVAGSARSACSVLRGARSTEELTALAAKNPVTIKFIGQMAEGFSKVPEFLQKAATYLKSTKLAKASSWIENILGKASGAIAKTTESLSTLAKSASEAANVGVGAVSNTTKRSLGQKIVGGVKNIGKLGSKKAVTAGAENAALNYGMTRGLEKGGELLRGNNQTKSKYGDFGGGDFGGGGAGGSFGFEDEFKNETGQDLGNYINNAFEDM